MSLLKNWYGTARSCTRNTNKLRCSVITSFRGVVQILIFLVLILIFQDEESGTSDVVKSLIETSALLGKMQRNCNNLSFVPIFREDKGVLQSKIC